LEFLDEEFPTGGSMIDISLISKYFVGDISVLPALHCINATAAPAAIYLSSICSGIGMLFSWMT
jgi:hypothetical protein